MPLDLDKYRRALRPRNIFEVLPRPIIEQVIRGFFYHMKKGVTLLWSEYDAAQGRWIIQEAADVRSATVDVVDPVEKRVLDYCENPWHVVQWTAATPAAGLRCQLVILDSREKIDRVKADGLKGKVVLTREDVRGASA